MDDIYFYTSLFVFDVSEYKGSPSQLDTAEHFLFKVIQIPYYVIRIDVILLREEFDHAMSQIDQSLLVLQNAMKGSITDVLEKQKCF